MSHEIFFPVPPSQGIHEAICYINARAKLFQLPTLDVRAAHRSIAIARIAGQEQAYAIYTLMKSRIVIERIVVHPNFRRQGWATRIVIDLAERYTPRTMQMTIDASNIEANEWARAVGFGATKFIRGCESSGDKVQLEFMEIGNIEK